MLGVWWEIIIIFQRDISLFILHIFVHFRWLNMHACYVIYISRGLKQYLLITGAIFSFFDHISDGFRVMWQMLCFCCDERELIVKYYCLAGCCNASLSFKVQQNNKKQEDRARVCMYPGYHTCVFLCVGVVKWVWLGTKILTRQICIN